MMFNGGGNFFTTQSKERFEAIKGRKQRKVQNLYNAIL